VLVLAHVVHGGHGHGPHHAVQVRVGHGGGEGGHLHLCSGRCTHPPSATAAADATAAFAGDTADVAGGMLLVWVVLQALLGGNMLQLLLVQPVVVVVVAAAVAGGVLLLLLLLLLCTLTGQHAALHLRVAGGVQVLLVRGAAAIEIEE